MTDSDRSRLSHLDASGHARMVDVSQKPLSRRRATAEGTVTMRPATVDAIREGKAPKGDVLSVVRLAAIGGAKRTAELIPLCHPLPIEAVDVEIELDGEIPGARLRVTVSAEARTGVEMEAMCAVAAGLLAMYDMVKGLDRRISIGPLRLLEKRGGRSGTWSAEEPD